ncbi:hypothetical protein N018_04230 [Pseudomonas syringae CC1557]|uniref:Uncharacterized protein n=1 Tax=Pseudomonas syringae CC1557 TaxID=1357279 RepID=W0N210_PSESX|nr:hypothetical protein N018_04230 [Pseudomonas syringae CC1557]
MSPRGSLLPRWRVWNKQKFRRADSLRTPRGKIATLLRGDHSAAFSVSQIWLLNEDQDR